MPVSLVVIALLLAVAVAVSRRLARVAEHGEAPALDPKAAYQRAALRSEARREARRQRRLLPRPPADQPPADLTPLIPSPRVVAQETERGLREIEQWLADQGAA